MFEKYNLVKLAPHFISLVLILLINIAYFYPQLEGKKLIQGDIVQANGGSDIRMAYAEKTGKTYLWNPSMFGGMPILANPPTKTNYVIKLYKYLRLGFDEPIGMFTACTVMSYLMLVLLGINPWLSLLFSITVSFSTNNLILWEAGHNAKIRTLIFTPLLISGILLIFERQKYLLGALLLGLGVSMSLYSRHPQMSYYIFLAFLVYGAVKLVSTYKNRHWKGLLTSVAIMLVAGMIGLGTSAGKVLPMTDYSESSIRGKSIISSSSANGSSTESSTNKNGLDWEYAMAWSNGLEDIVAGIIPGFAGGSGSESVSTSSESFQTYRSRRAPLYWGSLPFTAGPIYFGASLLFFFLFGFMYLKGDLKWWLGIAFVVLLLLSMGKNLSFLNRPIFDYLPLYNKFRVPQSILSILPFFLPILGALALNDVLKSSSAPKKKSKKESKRLALQGKLFDKSILLSTGIMTACCIAALLAGYSVLSFESATDARFIAQGNDVSPFIADRKSLLVSDSFRTLLLVWICAGSLWLVVKKKINVYLFYLIIGLIFLFDFIGVGTRYLSHEKFVTQARRTSVAEPRPVDRDIMALESDKALYRVHDLTINAFNSSATSRFHNTIGGYSGVKLRRIQDLIERHISNNNLGVLSMLNTKYFIVQDQSGQPQAQVNANALGPAWFVQNIVVVNSPEEEIGSLDRMDPSNSALVLDSEFNNYIGSFQPETDNTASISLTEYEPDRVVYTSRTSSEQLAIFSEIWYGPNKGWQAYIDGNPVDHIRANYVLRALRIPSGNHEIVFEFKPTSFETGENVALASNIIFLLAFLGFLFWEGQKRGWFKVLNRAK